MSPRPALVAAALGAGLFLLGQAGPAHAFHPLATFGKSALEKGGGAGLYYTGSPRWLGYDCSICHVGAAGEMRVALASELFSAQSYRPDEPYVITAQMVIAAGGGHGTSSAAGMGETSFLAEMNDDLGQPRGSFGEVPCPGDNGCPEHLQPFGGAPGVIAGVSTQTLWSFVYRTPEAGTGRITFHLGAVAGDDAATWSAPGLRPPTDPLGDDVFVTKVRICEVGTSCDLGFPDPVDDDSFESPAACALTAGAPHGTRHAAGFVLVLALALLRRRRARHRLVGLGACVAAAACFDPSLAEECAGQLCGPPPDADPCSYNPCQGLAHGQKCPLIDAMCEASCPPVADRAACAFSAQGCWYVGSCPEGAKTAVCSNCGKCQSAADCQNEPTCPARPGARLCFTLAEGEGGGGVCTYKPASEPCAK
jgi:hypothetical protein